MIDLKKEPTYKAKADPEIVDIPEMLFLMVDGEGAPEGSADSNNEFQEAMQILFGIFYTIRFWDKKHTSPAGFDKFTVTPVEGLWWTKSGKEFSLDHPNDWQWTVMLRVPDFVTPEFYQLVVNELVEKKATDMYRKARLERFQEGPCVQILHIGPYNQEESNIRRMHAFAKASDYKAVGKHHELYFSDPRRTKPEKLRTILRHPVKKV